MSPDFVVVTCEHGGNEVPPAYAPLFAGHEALLATHRGWDPGALQLARDMAAAFGAPLFASTTTRLLIDLNRSIGHRQLHSEATRGLDAAARRELVKAHYTPHRDAVLAEVRRRVDEGARVVHIASHSFTPELDGVVRQADVACLYDPRRPGEREVSTRWLAALHRRAPALRLRRNYPYQGKEDGLTSSLRRLYGPGQYVGIELEVNQHFVLEDGAPWDALRGSIVGALGEALFERSTSVDAPKS